MSSDPFRPAAIVCSDALRPVSWGAIFRAYIFFLKFGSEFLIMENGIFVNCCRFLQYIIPS